VQGVLGIEIRWVLVVLYDDVLWVVWIGDETLTWVHKHYVITVLGTSEKVGRFRHRGKASFYRTRGTKSD
jgi:hypothetical protein